MLSVKSALLLGAAISDNMLKRAKLLVPLSCSIWCSCFSASPLLLDRKRSRKLSR
ncbi:hypothetical protein D3C72_2478560 [compost metagenome]